MVYEINEMKNDFIIEAKLGNSRSSACESSALRLIWGRQVGPIHEKIGAQKRLYIDKKPVFYSVKPINQRMLVNKSFVETVNNVSYYKYF